MKKVRIGLFGAGGRGRSLVEPLLMLGCDVVAIFDEKSREDEIQKTANVCHKGTAVYYDFDDFIKHDMDAVILANYFHEHAYYAIRCFERGLHVFSECISNGTMAEGVELVRAFEKSNSIYMLAENYPQMLFNREIKRVCDSGKLGKFLYAEGEYNHPGVLRDNTYVHFDKHWRYFLPGTYYITHSLGPIMHATGATPKRVSVLECKSQYEGNTFDTLRMHTAVVMTQNDDGSLFRVTGCANFGAHGNSYRVCGTKGQIENLRGMGEQVMLRYNSWDVPEGESERQLYTPAWNDKDEELIKKSGHGGGDYLTLRMFRDCILNGTQPEHPFDLHSAITMASVAILGHRSMLEGGTPYDIPNFRIEEDRKKYENDRLTPFCKTDGSKPDIPACSDVRYQVK